MGYSKLIALFLTLTLSNILFINGKLIFPQKDKNNELKWWQETIVYQIYPRSHQDSDNDGIGDLEGIRSRLDHFADIGIGAVWISPIYKSPMKDFGYDISDFRDIEPIFGTMESFDALSADLKARNIKLIMDYIPNHSSDKHEWFEKSVQRIDPYTDYYVWKDPIGYDDDGQPIPPNNWISYFGNSSWEWNFERQQFYLHQFLKEQPDLNFENPVVLQEMIDITKFWLDKGVDGFRMDAVPFMFEDQRYLDEPPNPDRPPEALPDEWRFWKHVYTFNLPQVLDALAEIRKVLDEYTEQDGRERVMLVESIVESLDELFEYYGTDERPIAHLPLNFEFILRPELTNPNFKGGDIYDLVDEWFTKMPPGKDANWCIGNHDNNRVASRFSNNHVDILNMVNILLPGNTVSYYGEEIGMEDTFISWEDTRDPYGCNAGRERYEEFSRDPERTPMQWGTGKFSDFTSGNDTWLPMNPKYPLLNVQVQSQSEESHLQTYKRLSSIRKSDAWKYGSFEIATLNNRDVFAFTRVYNGEGFLVITNLGSSLLTMDAKETFTGLPDTGTIYARSVLFAPSGLTIGSSVSLDNIVVGPRHSLVVTF